MPMFRKRPVVVEARRFTLADEKEHLALADWCGGKLLGLALAPHQRSIKIETLEGTMRADIDDWIIKGIVGEFYPCKSEAFDATYEPISSEDEAND